MTEQLTDNTRAWLRESAPEALRIIDALTADRAALVAQLEAAEEAGAEANREKSAALTELNQALHACEHWSKEAAHNAAQVAELTRERDEAFDWRVAKRAEVTRLTRERDEAREELAGVTKLNALAARRTHNAESEVTRLTEALAAAERRELKALRERDAAEARVRELAFDVGKAEERARRAESECAALRAELTERNEARAELERLRDTNAMQFGQLQHSRAHLAAANALLRESCPATHDSALCLEWYHRRETHLANQPAAPTSADADQAEWIADAEQYLAECGFGQPTAPDQVRERIEQYHGPDPTRTATEQRVLDAIASIPENVICDWTTHVSDWPRRIAKAELARRERGQ